MSDTNYNQLILVFDLSSNAIVCRASSDAHAAAIVLGMINGKAMSFDKFRKPNNPSYNFDFNDLSVNYQLSRKGIFELPTAFLTKEWVNYRKLILFKANLLDLWEFKIRENLNRVNDFYGLPNMMPFLTEQLALCEPNNNYYTDAILEWSEIQETSAAAAYQELKIRQEGYGLVYLRSHAFYLKHVRKISTAQDEDEALKQFDVACDDFKRKAHL